MTFVKGWFGGQGSEGRRGLRGHSRHSPASIHSASPGGGADLRSLPWQQSQVWGDQDPGRGGEAAQKGLGAEQNT